MIRIDGAVDTDVPHDEWLDAFIEWIESRGEFFGGTTLEVDEEDE